MWFRTLFDSLKAASSRTPSRQARRGAPRRRPAAGRLVVEALEDRLVPASLRVSDATILEGNAGTQNAVVTVSLAAPSNQTVRVDYSTANGTALAASDYQARSGSLTFAPGQTSKSVLIPVIGDSYREADETFFVDLRNADHASIADGRGVVTIVDDDTTISITITDRSAAEGNTGTKPFVFTVTLSAASTTPVTVNWTTANGTAVAGSDYQAASGTLTFAPGQTSKTVTVLVNGNQVSEPNKMFFVNLSSPANAVIADGQGVATVLNDDPCYISINDVAAAEGNSGTTALQFTVTLSNASTAPVTVNYSTADYTATAYGSDYQAVSGTLTFAPGQTSRTVTVLVNGDRLGEVNENFFLNLSSPTNAVITDGQGTGIIDNDDPIIGIGERSTTEGNVGTKEFNFIVTLSTASDVPVTVNYATSNDRATAGSDYVAASGTLTIPAGQTSGTITVLVIGDRLGESNEDFWVILNNATNGSINGDHGHGIIEDDEPFIRIINTGVSEGNAGTKEFTFTVTLGAYSDAPVSVDYATADDTAVAGSDYVAASGTLTIPAGQLSGTITGLVNGDRLAESDETFFLNLSSPTNGTIIGGKGVAFIWDDDTVRLNIDTPWCVEGDAGTTELTYTVTLSAPSDAPVTVDYATGDWSAIAGIDYQATSGTLTFDVGETSKTIHVLVNGDLYAEYDEYFLVNLTNPTGAPLGNSQAWSPILNDDGVFVSIGDSSVQEPHDGETTYIGFDVWLSAPFAETVTVYFYTSDGSATADYDYVPAYGMLTFAPGETHQTIWVQVLADAEWEEGNEQFYVSLSGTSSNALIDRGWGTGAIWD